ncbi:Imm50 family immunity protein [Streptomyces microflavus]|uniref:Imm50 family immunity protein n=1 Tax=Streptomyces microflavus TaxID=1919 RepID=UPI0037F8FEBE
MTTHWADLAVQTRGLESLYSVIPPLDSVRLRSFHLDWRGPTLTTRIDLPSYPEHPPPDWSERGYDTLQIHLQFLAVDDLAVGGWNPSHPSGYQLFSTARPEAAHPNLRRRHGILLHLQ